MTEITNSTMKLLHSKFVLILLTLAQSVSPTLYSANFAQPSLRLVQILFRHGDRTPVHSFPLDEYRDYWLALGLGQLTNVGKEQHYEFGHYIRTRYSGFLNETYLWNEVVVNSTNVDRTLMSAAANLAGLYPPVGEEIWNSKMPWQPIPIHTTQLDIDYLLNPDAYCPRFSKLQDEVEQSEEFLDFNRNYSTIFEFLSKEVNATVSSVFDLSPIFDALKIEKIYNLSAPKWMNESIFNQMQQMAHLSFKWLYINSEEQLLKGGPLLKHVIENIDRAIEKTSTKKLFLYSSHDTMVTAFLMNLGVFNNLTPPYTAAVFIELHQLEDGYHVQLLYRNSTVNEPFVLTLPNCIPLCPLETFISLTKDKIPDDILKQCEADLKQESFSLTVTFLVICSTAILSAILFGAFICWRQRRDLEHKYTVVAHE